MLVPVRSERSVVCCRRRRQARRRRALALRSTPACPLIRLHCRSPTQQSIMALMALVALVTHQLQPLAPVLSASVGLPAVPLRVPAGRSRVYLTWSLRYGLTNQLYR